MHAQPVNQSCLNLMPCPQKLNMATGLVILSTTSKIYIQGLSKPRYINALKRLNLQLKSFDAVNFVELTLVNNSAEADIEISVTTALNKINSYHVPTLADDESYQLIIAAKNSREISNVSDGKTINKELNKPAHISIQANSDFGALHGLTTLVQLITTSTTDSTKGAWLLPQLTIDDKPRFSWRGLLIDSVRHFIPLNVLKRQLDGMAAAKFNVFHWHLTDDQGWRFESKRYPKLHQQASDNLFYSQAEIKELVHYASLLGIRVVPEFDVPGHASAIAVAYPELITEQQQYPMQRHWGVFEPLLDVSNPAVYQFIDDIVEELTALFPDSYIHIGGDEVDPRQWQQSDSIKALMQSEGLTDSYDVQRYFNSRTQKILAKNQRQMMGWDEILHPGLANNIMVQSWRGEESLNVIAASGYQGLLSTGYYIDQPQYSSYHYLNDPQGQPLADLAQPKNEPRIMPANNERWQTWNLSIPRLKGSAVKGSLTLIHNDTVGNTALVGYLKLNNNHHKKINIKSFSTFIVDNSDKQALVFSLDSWMGPLQFELVLAQGKHSTDISGVNKVMVGNSYYPLITNLSTEPPKVIELLPVLTLKQATNILGGEATLWTEMVDQTNIDLRTWPRLFVIAERFWSARKLSDIDYMYQRLQVIDDYAANIIGLQHQQQQQDGFVELLSSIPQTSDELASALSDLAIIAQAVEPAHYYTRHHLKYQQKNYHQQAALDNFVDYLPVESFSLLNMRKQVAAFIAGDDSAMLLVNNRVNTWHDSGQALKKVLHKAVREHAGNNKLVNLLSIVEELNSVTRLALDITDICTANAPLSNNQHQQIKQQLLHIEMQQKEQVFAAQPLFKQLLSYCHSLN